MAMTREQQQVFDRAVETGIVKTSKEAYERGAAFLRQDLQRLDAEKQQAEREEADRLASLQGNLF